MMIENFIESKVIIQGQDCYGYTIVGWSGGLDEDRSKDYQRTAHANTGQFFTVDDYRGGFGLYHHDNDTMVCVRYWKSPEPDPRSSYFLYRHYAIVPKEILEKINFSYSWISSAFPQPKPFDSKLTLEAISIAEENLLDTDKWDKFRKILDGNNNLIISLLKCAITNKKIFLPLHPNNVSILLGLIEGIVSLIPLNMRREFTFSFNNNKIEGSKTSLNAIVNTQPYEIPQDHAAIDIFSKKLLGVSEYQSKYLAVLTQKLLGGDYNDLRKILAFMSEENYNQQESEITLSQLDGQYENYERITCLKTFNNLEEFIGYIEWAHKYSTSFKVKLDNILKSVFHGIRDLNKLKLIETKIFKNPTIFYLVKLCEQGKQGTINILNDYDDNTIITFLRILSSEDNEYNNKFIINVIQQRISNVKERNALLLYLILTFNKDITKCLPIVVKYADLRKEDKATNQPDSTDIKVLSLILKTEFSKADQYKAVEEMSEIFPNVSAMFCEKDFNLAQVQKEINGETFILTTLLTHWLDSISLNQAHISSNIKKVKNILVSSESKYKENDIRTILEKFRSIQNLDIEETQEAIALKYSLEEIMVKSIDELFRIPESVTLQREFQKYYLYRGNEENIEHLLTKLKGLENKQLLDQLCIFILLNIENINRVPCDKIFELMSLEKLPRFFTLAPRNYWPTAVNLIIKDLISEKRDPDIIMQSIIAVRNAPWANDSNDVHRFVTELCRNNGLNNKYLDDALKKLEIIGSTETSFDKAKGNTNLTLPDLKKILESMESTLSEIREKTENLLTRMGNAGGEKRTSPKVEKPEMTERNNKMKSLTEDYTLPTNKKHMGSDNKRKYIIITIIILIVIGGTFAARNYNWLTQSKVVSPVGGISPKTVITPGDSKGSGSTPSADIGVVTPPYKPADLEKKCTIIIAAVKSRDTADKIKDILSSKNFSDVIIEENGLITVLVHLSVSGDKDEKTQISKITKILNEAGMTWAKPRIKQ